MFEVNQSHDALSFRFNADVLHVDAICDLIRRFLRNNSLERLNFAVQLLVRETAVNSIRHGCGEKPEKTIGLSLKIDGNRMMLIVEDQGDGFDWRTMLCKEPDLRDDCGRGLHIIRKYAHSFKYNDKGNRIEIVWNLNP